MAASAAARTRATRERVIAQHENRYRRVTDRYFAGFYRRVAPTCARVARGVQPTKADSALVEEIYAKLGTYSWDQEARILSTATTPVLLGTMEDAYGLVADELGTAVSFDLNARPVRSVLAGVGTRIRQVEDTSRRRIAGMIADGTEKGLSVEQIVRGVKPGTTSVRGPIPEFPGIAGLVDSWTSTGTVGFRGGGTGTGSRSYLIARTEVANAYNLAACDAYASSGVDFLEVFDGQDCGWSSHDSPDTAHGSIRSVEDCARQPISHPRCQRAFGARVDATAASPSPYAAQRARGGSVPGATPGIGAVDPLDADALHLSGHEKVARPTPAIAQAAQRSWERARAAEPSISRALQEVTDGRMVSFDDAMREIAAAPGGDLAGFAARRKSLTSLSRKTLSDMADAAEAKTPFASADDATRAIGDTVRYTVRFTEAEYAAGQRRIVEELMAAGNRPLKWKPKWSDDVDRGYRGINTNWAAPNGTVFEVQFHTPRSFVVKEVNHPKYEVARLDTTPVPTKVRLYDEMQELAHTVDVPPGVNLTEKEVMALWDDVVAGVKPGTAPKPKVAIDVFADDAVIAARRRLDTAKTTYNDVQFTYGVARREAAEELTNASQALEAEIREAIRRTQEAIRTMRAEEAKAALLEVRRMIGEISGELATPAGKGSEMLRRLQNLNRLGVEETARLRTVREQLLARQTELSKRLPFADRVLPRPVRASRARDVYDEAIAIEKALEEIYPDLPSGWTGVVKIKSPGRNAAAAFDWDQAIVVKPKTLDYIEANRLKVLLHEMLHSVSPDLSPAAYRAGHGWEEGVVEGATQMIYGRVREIMGRSAGPAPYQSYRRYTAAFRDVQKELGRTDEEFWPELLRVASQDRQWLISKWVDDVIASPTATTRSRASLTEAWQKLLRTAKLENKYG